MTRTIRLLAVTGALGLALTACGDGTARTGAAAVIGDQRITTTTLQEVVDRTLADPQAGQAAAADKVAFTRAALTRLVGRAVLTRAAADNGVSLSEGDVDEAKDRLVQQFGSEEALETQAGQSGIAKADLRGAIRDIAVQEALQDKLTAEIAVPDAALRSAYQQNIAEYDRVHSAHILLKTRAEADAVLAQVKADPTTFAALAAQKSIDTSNKDSGGDLGFQGRGALAKPFEDAIFNNPPGSIVSAQTQFGFHVIKVLERVTVTFEQAKTELRRGLLQPQRQEALGKVLQTTAAKVGVRVNPRFGTWQADELTITDEAPFPFVKATPTPAASVEAPAPQ